MKWPKSSQKRGRAPQLWPDLLSDRLEDAGESQDEDGHDDSDDEPDDPESHGEPPGPRSTRSEPPSVESPSATPSPARQPAKPLRPGGLGRGSLLLVGDLVVVVLADPVPVPARHADGQDQVVMLAFRTLVVIAEEHCAGVKRTDRLSRS